MSVVEVLSRIEEIKAAVAPPSAKGAAPQAGAFAAELSRAGSGGLAPDSTGLMRQSLSPFGSAPAGATAPGAPASGAAPPGAVPATIAPLIHQAAQAHGLDPALVAAVARAESGFNPNAGSPAGAQGLMQLMPATARGLGVSDPFDPVQSLDGGARYLKGQLDRFGSLPLALAAYNAGPGAVTRHGGVPPYAETQAYVTKVQGYYDAYRASGL